MIINELSMSTSVKPNGKEIHEDELYKDFNKYMNKYRDDHIEIYELSMYRTIHPGFGINWSTLGTQPVSIAKNFVKALNAAIKDVEILNKKYEGTKIVMNKD